MQKAQKMKAMESMLVSRMHLVNQMEIKAGNMAAEKGGTFAVREFGQRLSMDHTVADHKIMAYAHSHGLTIMSAQEIQDKLQQMAGKAPEAETKPQQFMQQGMSPEGSTPPAQEFQQQTQKAQSTMQKLKGMQGNAFDAAFTGFMVKGHTHAIATLSMAEHMLPSGNGLHSMLGNMIPILEEHYDIASRLQVAAVRRQNAELGDNIQSMMAKGGQ